MLKYVAYQTKESIFPLSQLLPKTSWFLHFLKYIFLACFWYILKESNLYLMSFFRSSWITSMKVLNNDNNDYNYIDNKVNTCIIISLLNVHICCAYHLSMTYNIKTVYSSSLWISLSSPVYCNPIKDNLWLTICNFKNQNANMGKI